MNLDSHKLWREVKLQCKPLKTTEFPGNKTPFLTSCARNAKQSFAPLQVLFLSLIFSVKSNTDWLHKVSDNGEESRYSRPKQGTKQHMQGNKTLLRITLIHYRFLPSSWMVHLPSSIGPFTEEISIHILTKECYLIIFHSILGSVRETCSLIQSFIACFVSSSSQACSWTLVLFRDQWACTVTFSFSLLP